MAVPKRRQSKTRSRKRNSHNSIKPRQLAKCTQCSTMAPTHVICPTCGYYQGRTLVEVEE
ncbi:MAG: 50S ribosomal protein L32 [Planctomycetaceae bacterium]|nr:50S ribosomal protein L32 [Planctomycetaceae bacterium]